MLNQMLTRFVQVIGQGQSMTIVRGKTQFLVVIITLKKLLEYRVFVDLASHGAFVRPQDVRRIIIFHPHIIIYLPFECDLFREICFEKLILDIPCEWDEWVIGHCSAECGVGTRTNTRVKRVEELNGGTCTGQPEEIEECMDKECPGEKDAYPCDIETGLSSYRTIIQ